jgi:hypothetical protein
VSTFTDTKKGGTMPAGSKTSLPPSAKSGLKQGFDVLSTIHSDSATKHFSTSTARAQTYPISILVDPRDERIRYVLSTAHYMYCNKACNAWIWELHDLGLEPQVYLLERKAAKARKQHWIGMCLEVGCTLFNRRRVEVGV